MTLLRPYQLEAARWLANHRRGYLADPPGLGKTRELLAGAVEANAKRVLVIAPAVALAHWRREFDLIVSPTMPNVQLIVSSYQKFVRNAASRATAALFKPDVVILDEAHMLKHRDSQRTLNILHNSVLGAPFVWPASGTPMPRNPYELYPIVRSLWPAEMVNDLKIASHDQWRERFTEWHWGDYGPKITKSKNVEMLREFLKGKLLRRSERDVLPELPPINWTTYPLAVSEAAEQAAFLVESDLTSRDREALLTPDASPNRGVAVARHELGRLKVGYALELIRSELEDRPDEKRIVFAYHRDVLERLRDGLASFGVAYIDGSTSLADREFRERLFQTDPATRVFVGQNEAAGLSLTLTAASHVDLVEPDWRTDMNVQDGKRAHRIGQTRPVFVRMLSMADTLDEALVAQHWRETKMRGEVIG